MIMWGTVMEGNPVNPAHTNSRIIPENHADVGLDSIPKDHVDAGTVPTLGNHIGKVTFIPKNHVDKETVHIHTSMLIKVRTLLRIKGLTTLLWMP